MTMIEVLIALGIGMLVGALALATAVPIVFIFCALWLNRFHKGDPS